MVSGPTPLYTTARRAVSINASGKGSYQVPRILMKTCVSHYHKHIEREAEGDGGGLHAVSSCKRCLFLNLHAEPAGEAAVMKSDSRSGP